MALASRQEPAAQQTAATQAAHERGSLAAAVDDAAVALKTVEWLGAAVVNVERAISQLEEAKNFTRPPYASEVHQQIRALKAIRFCMNDLSAQLQGI